MKFNQAITLIDQANKKDPNIEEYNGVAYPKEYIYGVRMSERLEVFLPNAPESLRLAARCQHICRWEIPRNAYPMDRVGYLTWRNDLKKLHAKKASEILSSVGYNQDLIDEVKRIKKISDPVETLLVADSLSGQDAVNTAKIFNKETELTGLILTRLDGDQRGGACLSMKYITKLPIKFQGYGESVNDFDIFSKCL